MSIIAEEELPDERLIPRLSLSFDVLTFVFLITSSCQTNISMKEVNDYVHMVAMGILNDSSEEDSTGKCETFDFSFIIGYMMIFY